MLQDKRVDAKTQLNMVIGYPLSHTESPALHDKIYQALNINAVLLAFANPNLSILVDAIRTLSVGLTAVTMPFKEKIIPYLDGMSEEVKALQSANTLIQRDNQLWGYNTDIAGIARALKNVLIEKKKVLVIGAGGAARAVGYFLQRHQAQIFWFNRTSEKAKQLSLLFSGEVLEENKLELHQFDMIIQTTPIGMSPDVQGSIFSDEMAKKMFHANQAVFDLIYNPAQTRFLTQAKKQGANILNGSQMFIGQAIQQVALWTNRGDLHELYCD